MSKGKSSRYTRRDAKSRRAGYDLFGRIEDWKNARYCPPGMHGAKGYPRPTGYGRQLNQKRIICGFYGLKNKYFHTVIKNAKKTSGNSNLNIVRLLESRLDVVLYKSGLAPTMRAAKQLINHKHIIVKPAKNLEKTRIINIPSYLLQCGDEIEIKESSRNHQNVLSAVSKLKDYVMPDYLETDPQNMSVKFLHLPKTIESVRFPTVIDFGLLQSYYS